VLTLQIISTTPARQRILWSAGITRRALWIKLYQRILRLGCAPTEVRCIRSASRPSSPMATSDRGSRSDRRITSSAHGKGAMMPAPGSAEYEAYNEWVAWYWAEGFPRCCP